MTTDKYNGWSNRSTWLAVLHLDNTTLEVYEDAKKLAIKYNEMISYWESLKKRDYTTYSYPFHQHKAIEISLKNLLNRTNIKDEVNYRFREIEYKELFNHFID